MPQRSLSRASSGGHARRRHKNSSPSQQARRSSEPFKHFRTLIHCSSEPMLRTAGVSSSDEDRSMKSEGDGVLFRPRTCTDVLMSSLSAVDFRPRSSAGYDKDAKILVNVMVEGSPGPVRAVLKLGTSVAETIRLVLDKYREEGRTPKLDKVTACSYELHQSYFSLSSLNKAELIGDVGGRNFYLRKSNRSEDGRGASGTEVKEMATAGGASLGPPLFFLTPCLIARKIGELLRRISKHWKIWVCGR